MAAKKEKPVYAFCRRGNALHPELEMDLRALDGVAQGQRVKVEIKEFRSLPRLRLYWTVLSKVVDATECAPTPEHLHAALKLELGYGTPVRLGNGLTVLVPASIAFEKMTEAEFTGFFDRAIRFLSDNYAIDPLEIERAA